MDLFTRDVPGDHDTGQCLLTVADDHFTGIGSGLRVGVPYIIYIEGEGHPFQGFPVVPLFHRGVEYCVDPGHGAYPLL